MSNPEIDWQTASMAQFHSNKVNAYRNRALLWIHAYLKQIFVAEGRIVVDLKDVESYAKANGYLQDLVQGVQSVQPV